MLDNPIRYSEQDSIVCHHEDQLIEHLKIVFCQIYQRCDLDWDKKRVEHKDNLLHNHGIFCDWWNVTSIGMVLEHSVSANLLYFEEQRIKESVGGLDLNFLCYEMSVGY